MIKVGISGKIAAGKSQVENIIQDFGYMVFDLDKISHNLFDDEKIKTKILSSFDTLDRKKIGEIVFSNAEKKEELENIIYPELKKYILEIFEKYSNEQAIFISGALLFKSGFYELFDKTIFIEANEEIRLKRLIKRNNLDKKEAQSRLNLQDDGILADYIIENNGDIEALKEKTKQFLKKINL